MFDSSSSFSFSNLSLAGVQAASGAGGLPPGRYACKTKGAEVVKTKDNKGAFIKVMLADEGGKGVITARINVFNQNAEAVRIGKEQLRALAEFGGHQDPDNIGKHGIESLNGLRVGVLVGSEQYQGEDRSVVKGFMHPDAVATGKKSAPVAAAPAASSIADDDSIPF